ncbi:MAG: hypothetical protein HY763_00955 [Planctomycetes bacterium]|nr:hypothetical protein [Planctomycetota bacterium]
MLRPEAWLLAVVALAAGGRTASAQFIPGRIYAGDPCSHDEPLPRFDRIWELDPFTGNVRLFVEMPYCAGLSSLAATPDGLRLRAAFNSRDLLLEFDSAGNYTVALDAADGFTGAWGRNGMAYNDAGDLFIKWGPILRFPLVRQR